MRRNSEASSVTTRSVQFEATSADVDLISDEDQEIVIQYEIFESANERLRHQTDSIASVHSTTLDKLMAGAFMAVLQDSLDAITVLRRSNNISFIDINLDFVPLNEKYKQREQDVETLLHPDLWSVTHKKFKRDICYIEKILDITVKNLQNSDFLGNLANIIRNYEITKEDENTLLAAKNFNQAELLKLRLFQEAERNELLGDIQNLTEDLGKTTDELCNEMAGSAAKIRYLKNWQEARSEQNKLILKNKETGYSETARKMTIEIDKEVRIHDEIVVFLGETQQEYEEGIEKWMEKYDEEIDDREESVNEMKQRLENQRESYLKLMELYDKRQQEIDSYKEHKLMKQKEAEELARRTSAAVKIQSWWRGVMFRKGLGPFRRKKGKGKRGGSAKNSGKKKN